MRILGIDPGIGRTGWAVIEAQGPKLKVQSYGLIETKPNSPIEDRLLIINKNLEKIYKSEKPDVLSIEDLFFSSNAKTAFAVGQARGVVLLLAAKNKMSVNVYTPLQVKIALTGYGRADKNQVGQMVKNILSLEKIPKIDDTSDALAVALTHALSSKLNKLTNN